ncbi:MAG: glycosyltransferase family 4 protein [Phycisphaerales bacterium]
MSEADLSPMKIAIVIESFDPHAGGLERSTAQIATELAERGHAVTLLAGRCKKPDCLPGVTILAMARRKSSSALRLFLFSRWAAKQLQEGGYDTSLSMTTAVAARVIQPRGGTTKETLNRNIAMRPSPLTRIGKRIGVWLSPKHQLLLALEKRALNDPGLVKVAAVSRYVCDQVEKQYGLPAEKVELIPNAAVMPKVDDEQRAEWRKRIRDSFKISDDTTVFLFAAINPRLKGFTPLMLALAHLKERHVPAMVLLAGDFWHQHNREAEQRGVRDRVCFLRHTRQIEALYSAADVTVQPTFYDPASKVVIESLMMGVSAISTAYNGASDLISPADGPSRGRVIPDPADAVALADAMQALADPAERESCRAACVGLESGLSMAGHVDLLKRLLWDSRGQIRPNPAPEV